jgi:hypothetical protein
MKKVFLASLIVVLLGALIVPGIVAPAPAAAWSGTVTCSADSLHFRVYSGVPTYLLGFIPLDDGQTLTLTHAGGGIAGWTVSDNAGWLNENLLFGVISGSGSSDIIVRVNTDGLDVGTQTATITFKLTTCGTTTITVPVTVDVIEPTVMGPLGIGVDKELLKNIVGGDILETENAYSGLVLNLLTNPADKMDMQAIETDGCWNLSIQCGAEIAGKGIPIAAGALTIGDVTKPILNGMIAPMSALMTMIPSGLIDIPAGFDWGENYAIKIQTTDRTVYIAILIGDIGKLMDLMPVLLPMFSTAAPAGTTLQGAPNVEGTNNGVVNTDPSTELTIPLKPILNLLPSLMPVLSNLLSNETVMAILTPLMSLLPPIIIVLPYTVMMDLFSGLM